MAADAITDLKYIAKKYLYLINSGAIALDDLAKALTQSLVWKIDIEPILFNDFGVSQKELDRSLENDCRIPRSGPAHAGVMSKDRKSRQDKCLQSLDKLRRYIAKLERSNKELENFAFIASHDLQEPLRKINFFADLLLNKLEKFGPEEKEYLEKMKNTAERMQKLIDSLLVFSRKMPKEETFKPVDMNVVISEVLDNLETRISKSEGTVNVGSLPTIRADSGQIFRLFQNLIGNALKYHKKNQPPVVDLTCRRDSQGDWVFSIKDNGIGIADEYFSRIFQPLERLHGHSEYEGTGMGLAICDTIVERHGGSLSVSSAEGEGTVFSVTLPGF